MEVSFSTSFKKSFRKRVKGTGVEPMFWQLLEVFMNNPFSRELKAHKLSGKLKGLWSFSVEHDIRIIFYFTKDNPVSAVFVDIGTHDEVY
jgi:addiction module RelE/StbE family toxin